MLGGKYNRAFQLERLIGLWPWEIEDRSPIQITKNIDLLRRSIKHMRRLALSPQVWTYDVNRHIALKEALEQERKLLRIPRISHEVQYLQDAAAARLALHRCRRQDRAHFLEAHRLAIANAQTERAFRLREAAHQNDL